MLGNTSGNISVTVFARIPLPGAVKTRLTPALPAPLACALYVAMLRDTLRAARAVPASRHRVMWATEGTPPALPELGDWVQGAQRAGDLGERLMNALADENDARVVVGSDCPELDAPILQRAQEALRVHDMVLGPAIDGGYYLVGLAQGVPADGALFAGVPWGTGGVREATLARAAALGLDVEALAWREDVDTPADLIRLLARLALAPHAAPLTRAALEEMKLLP